MGYNTDFALIDALKKNDEEAFEFLYQKYSHLVYHVCLQIVHDIDVANDLVQDTFIAIYEASARLDSNRNFKYYIVTIAHNKAIEYLRKQKEMIPFDEEIVDDQVEEKVYEENFASVMSRYRTILNDDELDIIVLHLEGGLRFKDIAVLKKTTLGTVTGKYDRGIKKIKEKFLKGN